MELEFRALLERPRQLLTVAVAAAAAVLIGQELYSLFNTLATPPVSEPVRSQRSAAGDPVAAITQAGLFGKAATPVASTDDSALPQSSAQLVLRGVFTGNSPEQGSAIFELPDGSTRMVRAGGSLDGGLVLQRIYPGRVVLNRNGLNESLSFPASDEYAESIAEASTSAAASEAEPEIRDNAPSDNTDDEKRANILRRLEELRARSLERNQG